MSSPSSQWHYRLCRCAGIFAIATMVLLPSLAGSIANIAWTLIPLLHWRCYPYHADLFALTFHECHHCRCTNIVAPIELACLRLCAGVVALLCWRCHPWSANISTLVVQASLLLLCLLCADDSQASSPSLSWHVLSREQRGRPRCRQWQHQHNKGNNAITTRAATPAQ